MAQSGSVLAWGARGRGFKSRYPDNPTPMSWVFLCILFNFQKASGMRIDSSNSMDNKDLIATFAARSGAVVARRAHNPKVVGSSPASATKGSYLYDLFYFTLIYFSV